MIRPPVTDCYSGSRKLVSYLTTEVKLYTCGGVKKKEKVALQCKACSMVYNPVQFGNKHQIGFQFYPEEQGIIGVTDTVSFEKNLLEWQCCLA